MDLLNLISDIYCEEDLLGFDKYIDTLRRMITHKDFRTPFCIGIFGKWGSGKTSFMHLLEKRLSEDTRESNTIPIIPIWFNPWRYEKEEHLIIPFLKTIEHGVDRYIRAHEGMGEALLNKLGEACLKIGDVSRAFAYGITAKAKLGFFGIKVDVSKMAVREEELNKRRIDEAKEISEKYSSTYYEIVDELKKTVDEKSFRIVVFVDDLDRCLPDKAVELLEAIKLFLDIEGYLFILGVDKEVVKKGISYRYRFFEHRKEKEKEGLVISPEDYLDKMIQLPIELPVIEHGRKRKFIETLLGKSKGFKQCAGVIIDAGIGENPRTLKRFINLLVFTVNLAETLKDNIIHDRVEPVESKGHKELLEKHFNPFTYLKWTILVFRYPKIHSDIKGNKRKLIDLQKAARGGEKTEGKGIQIEDERLEKVLAAGEEAGEFFPECDDDVEWLIERFIHLTESTVISVRDKVETKGYSQSFKQGDMVLIPKGRFKYGDDKLEKDIDYDYDIDVFPVTNQQYKEFLDDKYKDIDEKRRHIPFQHKPGDMEKPYNWNRETLTYPDGMGDHPVVFVSYNDALEFCKWRPKKKEKEGWEIRLPKEDEWEKAARGEDGRKYPWGDDFDFNKLNCADYHVNKVLEESSEWVREFREVFLKRNEGKALTTNVGHFKNEGGASPFGCLDMAGNVWEWIISFFDDTKTTRVLRGGSWHDGGNDCRCAYRGRSGEDNWSYNVGFRCVEAPKNLNL